MKLVHPDWERQLVLDGEKVPILAIENESCLYQTLLGLREAEQWGTAAYVLSQGDKIWEMKKKFVLLPSPFALQFGDRKLMGKLMQQMKERAYEEEYMAETHEACGQLLRYMEHLSMAAEVPLSYDLDIDVGEVMKALHLHIDTAGLSLAEQMLLFMKTWVSYLGESCFCFVQFRNFLPKDIRQEFYRNAKEEGLSFFLLEGPICDIMQKEDVFLIDKDLCQIFDE